MIGNLISFQLFFLPETNISYPLKVDGWNTIVSFGMTYSWGELLNFAEVSVNFKLRIIFSYRQLQMCKW